MNAEEEAARLAFQSYTPEAAKVEIATLKASREFTDKLFDGSKQGHRLALASWTRLHQIAWPGTENES